MVAGVCGGLAEYLGVDVTILRLLFVLGALMGGVGVVAYIAAWLIVPEGSPGHTRQQLPLVDSEAEEEEPLASSVKGEKKVVDKKLYRSRTQRVLGGVCGGLAEYFEVDVVIIRLVFVLLLFANAPAVIGYLIAWIVIPEGGYSPRQAGPGEEAEARSGSGGLWLGYILVGLGAFLLLRTWLPYTMRITGLSYYWRLFMGQWWPLALILLGVAFLFSGRGRSSS